MKKAKMKVVTLTKDQLSNHLIEQMWQLFSKNYDDVSRDEFNNDLIEKNLFFIGKDAHTNEFAGFSAMKLYKENASTLTPDPVFSAFYHSHPPALQRVAYLKSLE